MKIQRQELLLKMWSSTNIQNYQQAVSFSCDGVLTTRHATFDIGTSCLI